MAYALGSHAGAADGDQTNRSHESGGPVGSNVSEGIAYSLRAGRTQSVAALPVALRGRGSGGQIEFGEDCAPAFTVRTPGGGASYPMVATFGGEGVVHALTSEGADASEDGTGRGTPIVAMAFNPQTGGTKARLGYGDTPTTLQANQVTAVHQPDAIRRLTPMECERLQGFPDRWTLHQADGSEQSDSARYRQLGNSVAVPCVGWITRRLAAVDQSLVAADLTSAEGGEAA